MARSLTKAAVIMLLSPAAPAASAQPIGPSASAPRASAASPTPVWKPIYRNSQKTYYLDASNVSESGQSIVASLLEFKIPQVVNGDQVWSIVTRMKLSCQQRQIITMDNTLYALQMGGGPVVESQAVSDTWHTPQPGSLGDLIWSTACAKP